MCSATYAREQRGATNASFLAARPAGWQTAWRPLDTANASFRIAAPLTVLELSRLKARAHHDEHTVTAMQQVAPAFSSIAIGDPVARRIEPPRDASGSPIPMPAGIATIDEQPISLQGPLRSFALMPPGLSGQVSWASFELHIDPGAEASLARSRYMASANGVLYATN